MINNPSYTDIYNQIKAILNGCDTILDAIPFCNMYSEMYPHMKSMIFSYANGYSYNDNVDIKTKQNMLYDVSMCDTKDDALNLISKITDRSHDDVYKRTMLRIANRKHYKKIDRHTFNAINYVRKTCPHPDCGHNVYLPENTQYVICGYTDPSRGYDWNGCGKDWCFQCGKMLCKSWDIDQLHLEMNRIHDIECCKNHAKINGNIYSDDYCQCENYLKRTSDIIKTMKFV